MKFKGTNWIERDANYTLSVLPVVEQIDKELKDGNLSTWNLSDHDVRVTTGFDIPKVDWRMMVPDVLPQHLRYIASLKQARATK